MDTTKIDFALTDDEALLLCSGLGFRARDYSCLRMIGLNKFLGSDLFQQLFTTALQSNVRLRRQCQNFTESLQVFYDSDGIIISPNSYPQHPLFLFERAPLVFLGRGTPDVLDDQLRVSLIGSRNATQQGLEMTYELAKLLAQNSITVVSGGARGIDRQAHWGP